MKLQFDIIKSSTQSQPSSALWLTKAFPLKQTDLAHRLRPAHTPARRVHVWASPLTQKPWRIYVWQQYIQGRDPSHRVGVLMECDEAQKSKRPWWKPGVFSHLWNARDFQHSLKLIFVTKASFFSHFEGQVKMRFRFVFSSLFFDEQPQPTAPTPHLQSQK